MYIGTVTSKGQTTIPSEIRTMLELMPGDKLLFEVVDEQLIIKKINPLDYSYHAALNSTLSEWTSAADDEDFDDL